MEKSKSLFLNKKGFTLIEAVITMSIMGIVALIASSIMNYGLMATELGTDLRDEQGGVRLASIVITNELRNAYDIQFVSNYSSDNIDRSFYVSGDSFYRFDGVNNVVLAEEVIQSVTFTIEIINSKAYIDLKIIGVEGYEVNTKILLVNADPSTITTGTGSIITYDYVGNGRN